MTRDKNNKEEYLFSFQSVQNTKIVILNKETGNNVVITPAEGASTQFELSPFFIEELRQAVLEDAVRYLVIEADRDLSIRNIASIPVVDLSTRNTTNEQVFIPRYFYGTKEDVREALPKDRQITHIFKEKPMLIRANP